MHLRLALLFLACLAQAFAIDWATVPKLPQKLVPNWAQLPAYWNLGETSGVTVDARDHVWVFNRGKHPVIEFDKTGKFIQAWEDTPVVASHGIKADPEGNIWLVDVFGHAVLKFTPAGRLLMVIANAGRTAGDDETPYAFNRPTGIVFQPNGDFLVSDGYVNSRVVSYSRNGVFLRKWGSKGAGDSQFDIAHDVALDKQGRVYVADRTNNRIQIFDLNGKFLSKWTDVGQPWGLAYSEKENALYMADGLNNRVVKLNTEGQILGALGAFGKVPGTFDFAHHLAVDSDGSLYVAEIKNWRVQKFAK